MSYEGNYFVTKREKQARKTLERAMDALSEEHPEVESIWLEDRDGNSFWLAGSDDDGDRRFQVEVKRKKITIIEVIR